VNARWPIVANRTGDGRENAVGSITVVGAGLMGSGIAQVAAAAGHDVVLTDVGADQLSGALETIGSSLQRFVAKERISPSDADAAIGRITTSTDLGEAVADAEIVVEAVFERLDIKQNVFARLDELCRPDAVLATNTSAIPITSIAAATSRPQNVVGTHFFSPVPMMRLCELVRGTKTSDGALARARTFAESVGKTCIVVNRDVAGFVTTRLIAALTLQAIRLVETGVVTAADLDTACRLGFGHAMGPLETADLTGLDVMINAATNIYDETADPAFFPPELARRMVAAGDLGRKTGAGFYAYDS
jgi:3-hydroxybutyryl-CoA dehydrogenase